MPINLIVHDTFLPTFINLGYLELKVCMLGLHMQTHRPYEI
jgi:hypothetical protein